MAPATQMSAANTALEAIQDAIGVSILQYLPTDKIHITSFDDNKSERPNMMPVRMAFGNIKEGKEKNLSVWILLQKDHAADRSPEQRFNIFDRFGKLHGGIKADEAVRQTNAVTAFKCLKTLGVIDMDQLRAVIKYYFIAKGVNTPSPWLVGDHFINSLTAACKVAKDYKAKAAAIPDHGRNPATQDVHLVKLPLSRSQPDQNSGSSVKVNEQFVATSSSVSKAKARRTPQQSAFPRAPTASMVPVLQEEASASLFIPEVAAESSANNGRYKTPDTFMTPKAMSTPPLRPIPQAATAKRSSSATVNDAHGFLIHSDPVDADENTPMNISLSTSATQDVTEALGEKSPNSQSPVNFVRAYRKAIDDRDVCKDKIKTNKKEQKAVREEMKVLEARLTVLEEEERDLKEEDRLAGVTKKRLRQSLSEKERELVIFGAEMAERESKRLKKGTKSEDDTSGDEN